MRDNPARGRRSPADAAWALLGQLMLRQRRRFVALAAELELHPAQAGALLQMTPDRPLPMNELASLLHCDNSNVTGIVDRLEARGLVARRAHEQDRRVKQVVLTPEGVAIHDRIRGTMGTAPDSLRRLTLADQRTLRDLLTQVLQTEPPAHRDGPHDRLRPGDPTAAVRRGSAAAD